MKILFCKECHDAIKMREHVWVYCECMKCRGRYTDLINAEVEGSTGAVLCVSNKSLTSALASDIDEREVEAWVMFHDSERIVFKPHTLNP